MFEGDGDVSEQFNRHKAPQSLESVSWRNGQIELELITYVTTTVPPDSLTTSGRCIVLSGKSVLLMHNPCGAHILPGGRREPCESPRSATIREVCEETGIVLTKLEPLAVLVYRHLTPKPVVYPYPYPIFTNIVYGAHVPEHTQVYVSDTYELAGEFVPLHSPVIQCLPKHQQVMLAAAVQRVSA